MTSKPSYCPSSPGLFADRELLRRHQERNRRRGTGPQLALQASADYLRGWQETGHLDAAADPYGIAAALCGGALMYAWIDQLAWAEQVRQRVVVDERHAQAGYPAPPPATRRTPPG